MSSTRPAWQKRSERPGTRLQHEMPALSGEAAAPLPADRIRFYLAVLGPWLVLYEIVQVLVDSHTATVSFLPFEARIPVWEWTTAIYASLYPLVLTAPLLAPNRGSLRRLSLRGWAASVVIFSLYLTAPFVAPPRSFQPTDWTGQLLAFERSIDTSACALPSFHVIWAFLSASVYAERWPSVRLLWFLWAAAIAASCVTTSAHALADVAASLALLPLLFHVGRARA